MADNFIVYTTTDTQDSAKQIAKILVTENLAACCTITQNVSSIYFWNDIIHDEIEQLLMIKTSKERVEDIIKRIKEIHSYELPEIIAVPIVNGLPEYLDWINLTTK